MPSLYWLQETVVAIPLVLWVYLGLGIPYALLVLPRADWWRRAEVLALGFAFGPALLTAWMLILGVIGGAQERATLRFDWAFGGTVLIALVGIGLVWRKARRSSPTKASEQGRLALDERLLIALIVIAVLVRWVVTAYWSFTAYDALWVYGYQGRLYHLLGYIPQDIGYYPQFLQLQYLFMQLPGAGFNDHMARAVIPFLHIGSILGAYVLGSRLFTRRVGIFTASIWALYPHMAQWAHVGDLEIPLTFSLTLTMAFFLVAWMHDERAQRRRYAFIAGLCFGVAMWTKPTAGAFIYGVMVLVIAELVRVRFDWRRWLPRFEVAFITGLACIPLGSVWYLRNIALGLPALVFPHESWLTRATRSGDLLSFPLLALLLAIAYLASKDKLQRGWMILIGVVLVLAGTVPSSPLIDATRRDPPLSYITLIEAGALVSGLALIGAGLWHRVRDQGNGQLARIGWAYLLITPYFMTWFWSYSYHARLSFPMVPVLILPIALTLAQWVSEARFTHWHHLKRGGWLIALIALSIPAIHTPITQTSEYTDFLWVNRYPNDFLRTRTQNPGVSLVAEQLFGYEAYHGVTPVVVAPGEQRLPFFMPHATIISDSVPTDYEALENATHLIYGSQARWRYENDEGIPAQQNRIVASLGRNELFHQVLDFESGTFEYELYEVNLDARFQQPSSGEYAMAPPEQEIIYGDAIRYAGGLVNNTQLAGNRVGMVFAWEVLAEITRDYHVELALLNTEDDTIYYRQQSPIAQTEHAYYSTAFWEQGEYVLDDHWLELQFGDMPPGRDIYRIIINFVDTETGDALPMTIDGIEAEGYPFPSIFSLGQ
ncbi:MAG: ArnT family glycosyltransferase [Anaerolineae bacterium]